MTSPPPSWLRRRWKRLACLLLLLGVGAAAIGVFAWKRCADAAPKIHPVAAPVKNKPIPKKPEPKQLQLLSSYSRPVRALAFSPDGFRLATAADGKRGRGEIRIWDLIGEREERRCPDFPSLVYSLAFSPDGKALASGGSGYLSAPGNNFSDSGEVNLWNLDPDAKPVLLQKIDYSIIAVAFSPQGDRLAAGSNKGSLTIFNRATRKPELSLPMESLPAKSAHTSFGNLAFSADGTSNTLLLAHKGVAPEYYSGGSPDLDGPTDKSWAAGGSWEHKRAPWLFVRDSNLQVMEEYLGGPHPAGMPVLFADGSVRVLRYDLSTDVLPKLWAWNDGGVVSSESME